MPVRPLAENDIPQVADLYWKVLRERKSGVPPSVHSFLSELYFHNPWIDNSIPSLVYEEKGRIAGFLGVIPRRMCFRGEPIRIAYGGNFVVDPDFRTTLAGLHLLRTYMAGPQDLSQTDSANDTSRALLERLGFTTIVPYSMYWVRLLRPVRSVTHAIAHVAGSALASSVDFVLRPFSDIADRFAATSSASPFRQVESGLQATELDIATLLDCLAEFRQAYSFWPDYNADSLHWLLVFMQKTKGHGDDLRKVILRDGSGKIVGWYIYYRTKGGFGGVAQLGGERKRIKEVLDHLFHDAWSYGVIALQGLVERRLIADFSEKNCFFTCRGGWTVAHSRKPQLLEALNNGDAFLSRLDGEWCLAFGG
jgi:Acetyltransferase (GNAT) family